MSIGLFVNVHGTVQAVDYIHHQSEMLGLHFFEASIGGFAFDFGINKIDSEEQIIDEMIVAYHEALAFSTQDKDTK